jgi:PPM family protein phosphatase
MSESGPSSFRVSWAALTDRGQRRDNNEDAWAAFVLGQTLSALPPEIRDWPEHGILYVVSDGMGGASAGEVASELCVQLLPAEVHARRKMANKADALRDAFIRTHEAITAAGAIDPEKEGMGATLSALWLQADGTALVGHVGDSRILHRPRGAWTQVTHDHNLGSGMVRRGEITEEMAAKLKFRALLEQAMGAGVGEIHPQIESVPAHPGDTWLLCTDGLYGPLGENFSHECDKALWRANLRESVHALVDAANAEGGPDNITVVLARCIR